MLREKIVFALRFFVVFLKLKDYSVLLDINLFESEAFSSQASNIQFEHAEKEEKKKQKKRTMSQDKKWSLWKRKEKKETHLSTLRI